MKPTWLTPAAGICNIIRISFIIYHTVVSLNLGAELPGDGVTPKHVGAVEGCIEGAFVGVVNE